MKTCLLTGASRGFGESLARRLKADGYSVWGLGRDEVALDQLVDQGVLDERYVCDLGSADSIQQFLREFEKDQGLDLLVHNAGYQGAYSVLEESSYCELLQREMDVNFTAPVLLTRALLPLLLKQPSQIVVVTSLLQYAPKASAPGYCASKAALASWTRNLRLQLSGAGVRVTEVIPGLIKTTMSKKASEKGVDPDLLADQVVKNLARETIVGKGAGLGYALNRLWPWLFAQVMSRN